MSGTSIDAIDVALVEILGHGLTMRVAPLRSHTQPLGALVAPLRRLAEQQPCNAGEITRLAHALALAHVAALRALLDGQTVDLVAVHGQTVHHAPPLSWQLVNPAPIAEALRAPVVFDLRARDLAAGGQGAPITPLADALLFTSATESRAVVNLGGFCNLTWLPRADRPEPEAIRAGDVCACNQVLDGVARAVFDRPFDDRGSRAAEGSVHAGAYRDLVEQLTAQAGAGRSLGTGDELSGWLERHAARVAGPDLARSACAAIAQAIVSRVGDADRLLLAGGGVKNRTLCAEIGARARAPVSPTDDAGVPAAYREAIAMAVLGALAQDRVPITLPQVTGCRTPAPLSGSWILP